jgi:hypothetical protein
MVVKVKAYGQAVKVTIDFEPDGLAAKATDKDTYYLNVKVTQLITAYLQKLHIMYSERRY